MFTDSDVEFHTPADADHEWAETNSFALTIPERRMVAFFYVVIRKGLGAMLCDVSVFSGLSRSRANMLYIDSRQHLPAPERLSDFTTASGLSVRATSIRDYEVDYQGLDGVSAHFTFRGLMEPFDIGDPNHSPHAAATAWSADGAPAHQAMYAHHFDLTGRITGHLTIGGEVLAVDCVETMDHSWGPRPEMAMRAGSWMHAHFGDDLAMHWINSLRLDKPASIATQFKPGYVMEDGQVHGIQDMSLVVNRDGAYPASIEARMRDVRGHEHELHGSVEASGPWSPYTSTILPSTLTRWTLPSGRVGWGVTQENLPWRQLNRIHARPWESNLDPRGI